MAETCFKSLNTWRNNVATRSWKDIIIAAGWQVAEDYENRYYVIEGKR